MKKILYCLASIILFVGSTGLSSAIATAAPNGVEFELIVRQKPAALDKYFEITRDTVQAVIGRRLYTSLVNMTLDLNIETADSQSVTFTGHLVTIGRDPFNLGERYRIEFNLPARMDNIPGKNGSVYQLLISPRHHVDIDTVLCPYDPGRDGDFKMDPSSHFNIYYVPGSLADHFWNNIKNYLEADITQFRHALDINAPGKIDLHIAPCAVPTIHWDKRFGYAIDPGRSNIYAIHNLSFSSVDAILPNMVLLMHLWGYAPPFLVEGLAGYFDFVTYKMKKIKKAGDFPIPEQLLTTSGYYNADPDRAEIIAASFVKFLADSRGIGSVRKLYEKSDDLTLMRNITEIYGLPIDSLEAEWLHYLDTLHLNRNLFDLYAGKANALFRSDLQLEYLEVMTQYDENSFDSLDTWRKLATTCYQYGHYYRAEEAYRRLLKIDSAKTVYYLILGNLAMINGEYDHAWTLMDTVLASDSTYSTALLQMAMIRLIKGDTALALDLARKGLIQEETVAGKIEYLLFLGELYDTPGKYRDSAKVEENYKEALLSATDLMQKVPQDPAMKLRVGMALMGLRRYDEARQYLEVARFTEQRTFYLGRIALYLGRLYDLMNDRDRAMEYYREGLGPGVASYHRDLCQHYLEQPYKK
nr:hypothetical protein [candidate division Zixibacteria bacterium]